MYSRGVRTLRKVSERDYSYDVFKDGAVYYASTLCRDGKVNSIGAVPPYAVNISTQRSKNRNRNFTCSVNKDVRCKEFDDDLTCTCVCSRFRPFVGLNIYICTWEDSYRFIVVSGTILYVVSYYDGGFYCVIATASAGEVVLNNYIIFSCFFSPVHVMVVGIICAPIFVGVSNLNMW